MKSWKRTTT